MLTSNHDLPHARDAMVRGPDDAFTSYTVVQNGGSYTFHLLPSSILHPELVSVLAPGTIIDLDCLRHELSMMEYFHVSVNAEHLKLSQSSRIRMPVHIRNDVLAEERRSRDGPAPTCVRKTLDLGDLNHLDEDSVRLKLREILDIENGILTRLYDQEPISETDALCWCRDQAAYFKPYICDTRTFLQETAEHGGHILAESQLGPPPGMRAYSTERIRGVCYERT